MNNSGYRINGGIGFTIDSPQLVVTAIESNTFSLNDEREYKLDDIQIRRISQIINKVIERQKFNKSISVALRGSMPTHSGFGSGTAIRLSCIEALYAINEAKVSEEELVEFSGRGGTSGIGIRTYFHGGYVFEIGHKNERKILPSSLAENLNRKSLLIDGGLMPEWSVGILIPKNIKVLDQSAEKKFFIDNVPIPNMAVYETLYHVVFGLYASIKENDFDTFITSIKAIQNCPWKAAERNIYGTQLVEYENLLYKFGADAVGMSSLGPSLFFFSKRIDSVIENMNTTSISNNFTVIKSKVRNVGRIIS